MRGTIINNLPILLLVLAYITAAVLFVLSAELFRTWWRSRAESRTLGWSALCGFAGILSLALPFRYTYGWILVVLFLLVASYGLHSFATNHKKALRIYLTTFAAIGIAISISSSLGLFSQPRSAASLNRTLDRAENSLDDQKGELVTTLEKLAKDDRASAALQSSDPTLLIPAMQQLMVLNRLSTLAITDTTSRVIARGESTIRNDFLIQTEPWTVNSINGETVSGIARVANGKVSLVASTAIFREGKIVGVLSGSIEITSALLEKLSEHSQSLAVFTRSSLVDEGGNSLNESLLLSSRALEDWMQDYLTSHPKGGSTTENYLRLEDGAQYRLLVRTITTFTSENVALVILQPVVVNQISPTASVVYSLLIWSSLAGLFWLLRSYLQNLKKEGVHEQN